MIVSTSSIQYQRCCGHAHVAFGAHYINWFYSQYVDLVAAYSYEVSYLSAIPTDMPPYTNMTKPFTLRVWLLLFATLLLVMLIYAIFAKLAGQRNSDDWFVSAMDILGHQLSQSLPDGTKTSVNIFLISWTWYAFFVHSLYDCNLRAYMLAADKSPLVDSVQDIWDQGRCLHLTREYPEKEHYEAAPEDFVYEKLVVAKTYEDDCQYSYDSNGYIPMEMESKIIEEGAVITQADLIFQSTYAMDVRARWGYDPFRISKEVARLYHRHAGLPIKKGSVLKKIFDPQVLAMRSAGLLQYFVKSYYLVEVIDEPLEPIDLRHFLLGFGVYFAGLILSGLAFMYEYFLKGKTNKKI